MKNYTHESKTTAAVLVLFLGIASCTSKFDKGIESFELGYYVSAKEYFEEVPESDKNFIEAQVKLAIADSLINAEEKEKRTVDSLARVEEARKDSILQAQARIDEINLFKADLKIEIESVTNFDGSLFRGSLENITIEMSTLPEWGKMIRKAEESKDPEVKKLGRTLKSKVSALQVKELPKIRKEYGNVTAEKLWTQNITVTTKGTGSTTIEFVGALFASNQNIQDFAQTLSSLLKEMGFKRMNYKWYKGQDEYTYYKLTSPADSEIR